jgi:hypothetical protein
MKEFIPQNIYPRYNFSNYNYYRGEPHHDDRAGLLLPFLAGAVITAPLWYLAGANRPPYYPPYPQFYPPYPVYPQFNPYYRPMGYPRY